VLAKVQLIFGCEEEEEGWSMVAGVRRSNLFPGGSPLCAETFFLLWPSFAKFEDQLTAAGCEGEVVLKAF